ncbi:tRNA (adenosine(37)-N6)-threonylcarbamoyltransferase complex dimerization subunit type 1 TsaB [uncultured Gemella sp.]|uniref:tRNA (adenosine(37)-N6)-threonylcarbamoyltransferase complex dimerization subunit type 1 TsaB n=1 Tax=uncultured Gemella sp. TaxID=254352 RepID=UPI0028D7E161|nr:tRNA (adenosine(37)-N6)-threonylcarbamoyltransferase complex dimerization subunit type 1 TsaB [uncultured Gemella sp.]
MVSLIVEASNGVCSIACFENKTVLAEKNFVCSNNLSAVILEEIDNCLKEANKKKTDLTEIISSEGPGSYTAIRVVAAVCKTLAYTLKIKLKKVSSLKLQALLEFDSNKLLVSFIDARRTNVFGAVYKNEAGKLVEVFEEGYYSLEEINNFLSLQNEEYVYISKDIAKLNDYLLDGSKNDEMVRAANVIKIYDSLEEIDCYNMKPQYLRKTEAERELENDKNK